MRSRVTLLKHPLHPMLVMFPVALLPVMVLLDLVAWASGADGLWVAGFWIALAGVVMTLLAIGPGILDLAAIPNESRAHRVALFHLGVGIFILVVYAAAVWARWPAGNLPTPALALGIDIVGTVAVFVQGWLGGELVYKHHVGVDAPEEGGEPTPLQAGPGVHVPPVARGEERRGRGA